MKHNDIDDFLRDEARRTGFKAYLWAAQATSLEAHTFHATEYMYMPSITKEKLESFLNKRYEASKQHFEDLLSSGTRT